VAGCCECGDEPSGSGAAELLVISLETMKIILSVFHARLDRHVKERIQTYEVDAQMFRIGMYALRKADSIQFVRHHARRNEGQKLNT
jgi:hypothetical protein